MVSLEYIAELYLKWWETYHNIKDDNLQQVNANHPAVRAWDKVCKLNDQLINARYNWDANPLNLPHY